MNKLIVKTGDGSYTLYVSELKEHYHSINGALQESVHIYINSGFNYCQKQKINILEIGFGTGLNALLTCYESKNQNKNTFYHAVELFPLDLDIVKQLNYPILLNKKENLFMKLHLCEWEKSISIVKNFTLLKTANDIITTEFSFNYDVVYFDAFAPNKQKEVWDKNIFERIFNSMNNGGILVTYSTNGDVKRTLKEIGFTIELLPGPPGKRHILRAKKNSEKFNP